MMTLKLGQNYSVQNMDGKKTILLKYGVLVLKTMGQIFLLIKQKEYNI